MADRVRLEPDEFTPATSANRPVARLVLSGSDFEVGVCGTDSVYVSADGAEPTYIGVYEAKLLSAVLIAACKRLEEE